jgi:hypothetical protein
MTPYQTYQLWQIERPKTTAEQRAADAQLGRFAAAVSLSTRHAARTLVRVRAVPRARLRLARAVRLRPANTAARPAG